MEYKSPCLGYHGQMPFVLHYLTFDLGLKEFFLIHRSLVYCPCAWWIASNLTTPNVDECYNWLDGIYSLKHCSLKYWAHFLVFLWICYDQTWLSYLLVWFETFGNAARYWLIYPLRACSRWKKKFPVFGTPFPLQISIFCGQRQSHWPLLDSYVSFRALKNVIWT